MTGWDPPLATGGFLFLFPALFVVAGLDARRYQWSPPIPGGVTVAAAAAFVFGQAFAFWAVRSNPFFAKFVRIQHERGHHVVRSGPYAYVRHPGYAGSLLAHLMLPLILGSLWALVPAVIGTALFVVRTWLEDRTLQAELPGYRDYAHDVRWRLVPGVW
jgi:protein-S-isoprenylcysteine O-methyltransferase Ste14